MTISLQVGVLYSKVITINSYIARIIIMYVIRLRKDNRRVWYALLIPTYILNLSI